MNIFVYGTLLFKPVMDLVVVQDFSAKPASLHQYSRYCMVGRVYPGIVQQANKKVDGLVYYDVSKQAIARLDYFEGIEYQRKAVQVKAETGEVISADTYIITSNYICELEEKQWDVDYFEQVYIAAYLEHVRIIMAKY